MTASDTETILDILDSDMKGISALADTLAGSADSFDEQVEVVRLVREIVENHVATEQFLHPLIHKNLPDGEQIAHQQFLEHREMEATLRRLEDLDVASEAFRTTLNDIRDQWAANSRYLDEEIFPVLRATCDRAHLVRLADAALGAERSGPTRPRTLATEQPEANLLLSLTQGFVDKTIDAFSHRGHEDSDQLDARLQSGRYEDLED
ncbi:MAG TPA: hypothetical protein VGH11_06840 [Jatrophihabitans sp.]|jgi:hypothetical protein